PVEPPEQPTATMAIAAAPAIADMRRRVRGVRMMGSLHFVVQFGDCRGGFYRGASKVGSQGCTSACTGVRGRVRSPRRCFRSYQRETPRTPLERSAIRKSYIQDW